MPVATHPLQLINEPMVPASRQEKPANLAARVHPVNFPKYASAQIATVNPQVMPMVKTLSMWAVRMVNEGRTVIEQTQVGRQSRECKVLHTSSDIA